MSVDVASFLTDLVAVARTARVLTDEADTAPFQQDWRGRYRGNALAVVQPSSTEEVSKVVRLCAARGVLVIPQAGNTGLTGGAVASTDAPSILLNVSRLNQVFDIDVRNNSVTVGAGCILANLRDAVDEHDRQFPMLLGSVGSCEIGGLVSTNAGGTGVLRYGNMRDLVLGLEVVMPDGEIWNGLKALRKDNSGYDLKQLFIGAEGTLGIVTAAVLKLFPKLHVSASAMVALEGVQQAVDLLRSLQSRLGNRIEAFEVMSRKQIEVVVRHGHGLASPMALDRPWYVLIEIADSSRDWLAIEELENALSEAMEADLISDAVVATDVGKAERIWALRHNISEANKKAGFTVSNDTSVPVSKLPQFIEQVTIRLEQEVEGAEVCHAGHIGDGNIHVIALLSREVYPTADACESAAARVNLIVHELSVGLGGSISAEHGIGRMHVQRLERFKPTLDLQLMRRVKQALDPKGIMNPGKIFSSTKTNSKDD